MVEKLKNFIAGFFSITALLYAIGYISEVSNASMLGISSMIEPPLDYYLVAGGRFLVGSILGVYITFFNNFLYFIPFFIVIAFILQFEAHARKAKLTHLPRTYAICSGIFSVVSFTVFVPVFTAPLFLKDALLPEVNHVTETGNRAIRELSNNLIRWIQNADSANRINLETFYVMSLLAALLSFVMLVSMIRQLDRWSAADTEASKEKKKRNCLEWRGFFSKYLHSLRHQVFSFFVILIGIATVVQLVMIPANYGTLMKPNTYPCMNIEMDHGEVMGFMDNYDIGKSKLWLLRQNSSDVLLYGALVEKAKNKPTFKLLTLKKEGIRRMVILENVSVFKYK